MPRTPHLSRTALIASIASLFALFILIQAPAAPLLGRLNQESTPLRLQGLDGSLWRGSAASVAARFGGRWLDLGQLRWSMAFSRLPFAQLAVDLRAQRPWLLMEGRASFSAAGELRLDKALLELNGRLINPWLPLGYGVGGNFNLNLRRFAWRDGLRSVDVSGICFDAVLHLPDDPLPLGNLAMDVTLDDSGALKLHVESAASEKANPLELAATLLHHGQKVTVNMRAKPLKQASSALLQSLRDLAGQPDAEGYFVFDASHEIKNPPWWSRMLTHAGS